MGLFNFRERSRERKSFHKLNLEDLPASLPLPADLINQGFYHWSIWGGRRSPRLEPRFISGFKLSKMVALHSASSSKPTPYGIGLTRVLLRTPILIFIWHAQFEQREVFRDGEIFTVTALLPKNSSGVAQ